MVFKIVYLATHAAQAFILGIPKGPAHNAVIVNGAKWEVEETKVKLPKRRHAYVWASQQADLAPGSETEWLQLWNLATGDALEDVRTILANRPEPYDRSTAEEGSLTTLIMPTRKPNGMQGIGDLSAKSTIADTLTAVRTLLANKPETRACDGAQVEEGNSVTLVMPKSSERDSGGTGGSSSKTTIVDIAEDPDRRSQSALKYSNSWFGRR
jgi:hypothetical protein